MPRATGSTSCTRRPIISMGLTKIHNGWGETMRVGFIGLGAMGSRMAARLLAAQHDVVVYDRLPEATRSEEHTSELQSRPHLVCRLLLEKKNRQPGRPLHDHLRGLRRSWRRLPYLSVASHLSQRAPPRQQPHPLRSV